MRPSTLPAALLFCSLAFLPTLHAQPAPDYKSNPKFTAAMAEAKQLEKQRQVFFAIEAYKKASKIAQGGKATAYVCEQKVCALPTTEPAIFAKQISTVHQPQASRESGYATP